MTELINLKIKAANSIISIITSWFIAQASLIEQGFDQLFSLGLLIVAVTVIWKAFSRKDESETQLLREQIQILRDIEEHRVNEMKLLRDDIKEFKKTIEEQRKRIKEQRDRLNDSD